MTPMMYCVFPFGDDIITEVITPLGTRAFNVSQLFQSHIHFFGSRPKADQYANQMASLNGGRNYLVLETTNIFYTNSSPTKQKIWKNGELIPV